jgi:hypothetical protein
MQAAAPDAWALSACLAHLHNLEVFVVFPRNISSNVSVYLPVQLVYKKKPYVCKYLLCRWYLYMSAVPISLGRFQPYSLGSMRLCIFLCRWYPDTPASRVSLCRKRMSELYVDYVYPCAGCYKQCGCCKLGGAIPSNSRSHAAVFHHERNRAAAHHPAADEGRFTWPGLCCRQHDVQGGLPPCSVLAVTGGGEEGGSTANAACPSCRPWRCEFCLKWEDSILPS